MDRHFTIPEAVQLTGKSESTIKRLIRELRDNPGHPERAQLQPLPEEYEQNRRKEEAYVWRISDIFCGTGSDRQTNHVEKKLLSGVGECIVT